MNYLIFISIFIVIVLFVLDIFLQRKIKKAEEIGQGLNLYHQKNQRTKENRKIKILELLKGKGQITNNDVEKLLGVSDASTTNYLSELEREGRIEQIGQTGRSVYYKLKING